MSRTPNSLQRREQIIQGLLAGIAEQGYEKTTIQSIARKADLAPGLIHYHFKNKGEILLQLIDTLVALGRSRYEALAASAATPRARLRAYIDARLALGPGANTDAVAAWVVIGTEAVRDEQVRAAYQQAVADELKLVTGLVAGCLPSKAGAAAIAATLVTFIEGAFQLASAAREVMPKGYAAKAAHAMMDALL